MYVAILSSIFLILALLEGKNKIDKRLIYAGLVLIAIFLISRYPSGVDISNVYVTIYNSVDINDLASNAFIKRSPLFVTIIWLVKHVSDYYSSFLLVSNILNVSLISYTIYKNSNNISASIFLLLASGVSQIYITSGLRQCMAMSFFFFGYFNFLKKKKYGIYLIFSILSIMCHEVGYLSLVALLIELTLNWLDFFNDYKVIIGLAILAIVGFFFSYDLITYVYDYMGHFKAYVTNADTNYIGLGLRILLMLCISFIYLFLNKEKRKKYNNTIYIYYVFTLVYCVFNWIECLSRFIDYYAIVELITVPNMLMDIRKPKKDILLWLLLIFVVLIYIAINYTMLVDDINFMSGEFNYYFTFMNYPYDLIYKYLGTTEWIFP